VKSSARPYSALFDPLLELAGFAGVVRPARGSQLLPALVRAKPRALLWGRLGRSRFRHPTIRLRVEPPLFAWLSRGRAQGAQGLLVSAGHSHPK
jgi:hypothetical protein